MIGFTITATGGPLALAALYVPQSVSAHGSMGLVVLLSIVGFVPPLLIWRRYSAHVSGPGGLFAFVESAVGRKLALAQAAVWTISYALYLPYTITYMVYDLLPVEFPGIHAYQPALEIVLPLVVTALVLTGRRVTLGATGLLAGLQVVLGLLLVGAGLAHVGSVSGTLAPHGPASTLVHGSANVALLYICSSLPLFLGGEVSGGGRALARSLVAGTAVVMVVVFLGSLAWTHAAPAVLGAAIPGVALARAALGSIFARAIGVGVVASVGGVVVAEYVALSRLLHAVTQRPVPVTGVAIGVSFVIADALSLINPDSFYTDLVKPSLVALWVSQIVVFLVYPRFARRQGYGRGAALGLGLAAAALMAFGLYAALQLATST